MTKQEKIIVSAYTGILMCDFSDLHEYIEQKLGRPVLTHELADPDISEEIRQKTETDFIQLCQHTTGITLNEYQRAAMRTCSIKNSSEDDPSMLINGVMGLCGESGEAIDLVKKHIFQGHGLDKTHIAKELGDVAWYLAETATAIGYDLETILQMNVDKLKTRYPDGFDVEHSINRPAKDI